MTTAHATATPTRSCVACRAKGARSALVRFVADERGRVQPDPGQRLGGRGVYTCPKVACVEQAAERGGFARGLRRRVAKMNGTELARCVARQVDEERRSLLTRGRLDGRVVRSDGDGSGGVGSPKDDGSGWVPRDLRLARRVAALAGQVISLEA